MRSLILLVGLYAHPEEWLRKVTPNMAISGQSQATGPLKSVQDIRAPCRVPHVERPRLEIQICAQATHVEPAANPSRWNSVTSHEENAVLHSPVTQIVSSADSKLEPARMKV
jgi:hypothetical protein